MAPVDPFQEIAELGGRDGHHPFGRRRPDEAAPLEALGKQACALGIMPQDLDQSKRRLIFAALMRPAGRLARLNGTAPAPISSWPRDLAAPAGFGYKLARRTTMRP